MSRSPSVRHVRSPQGGAERITGERGFTLAEVVVVLAIIGLVVAIAIPNMARARLRSIMLSQMKQVRHAVMMSRMDAIKGGRQTVLGFTTELGRNALIAWRDDNGDETQDPGEQVIGRWTFTERVTIDEDTISTGPTRALYTLTSSLGGGGTEKGVVFLANGSCNCSSSGGVGAGMGAFLVSDQNGNLFRVTVHGGAGTVEEHMQDPNGPEGWSTRYVNWRY